MTTAELRPSALLDAALEYARRGWPVFPVRGKIPMTKHGFIDATSNETLIREWWSNLCPSAGIAVATGATSGVFIIDVDGPEGEKTLGMLEREHGRLPATLESRTGRISGRHLWFAINSATPPRSNAGKLGPKLDVRGDGGYVVVPPSIHPESRKPYQWFNDIEPAAAPPWLLELIAKHKDRFGETALFGGGLIPEGHRNEQLASLAGSMRHRGMTLEAIEAALLAENTNRCEPPLLEAEVRTVARSIYNYAPGNPYGSRVRSKSITSDETAETHLTDMGNAVRLTRRHGQDIHFCELGWIVWDGRKWEPDTTGEIFRRAKDTVRFMYRQAAETADDTRRTELVKHAIRSQSESRLRAMIELAKTEPGVPVRTSDLDRDPWLLNVLNGTIDLKTGELREHRRADLITRIAPVEYDAGAKCPFFENFIGEILLSRPALFEYMQRVMGYSLTGDVSEQSWWLFFGTGSNGKSTLLEIWRSVMGDYSRHVDTAETFLEKRGSGAIRNDLARLRGARLVTAIEVGGAKRLAESVVKQLTGGDTVCARFLHKEHFEFLPTFKIIIAANICPVISSTDYATWRRVRLIPFDLRIEPTHKDGKLADKLRTELSGILAWAVRGLMAYHSEGLNPPSEVLAAVEAYRTDMDLLAPFLDELCIFDATGIVRAGDLYQEYSKWCLTTGSTAMSSQAFAIQLRERGLKPGKGTRGVRCWRGIRLKTTERRSGG